MPELPKMEISDRSFFTFTVRMVQSRNAKGYNLLTQHVHAHHDCHDYLRIEVRH